MAVTYGSQLGTGANINHGDDKEKKAHVIRLLRELHSHRFTYQEFLLMAKD